MLRQPFIFDWLPEHPVFDSPLLPTQLVRPPLASYSFLTVQHLCDLREAMPHQWSPGASHPTPYLGKQRISLGVPRGGNHSKHVPQPTCLA